MNKDLLAEEMCCDTSSSDIAFIKRTKAIIKQYTDLIKTEKENGRKRVPYRRTLFVNCCLGLLFIPRMKVYDDALFNSPAKDWGIDTSGFRKAKGEYRDILLKDLIRHLRNSLSHDKFNCIYNQQQVLTRLSFEDYGGIEGKGPLTFSGQMKYKDFETLVSLMADYTLEK